MQGHTKAFVTRGATLAVLLAGATAFFPALAQTAPNLLTAGSFAVLGTATVTSTGPINITLRRAHIFSDEYLARVGDR